MRKNLYIPFFGLLFVACQPVTNEASGTSTTSPAEEINDSNTPLHLLRPNYETAYEIPQDSAIKATMDRVLSYLEESMPATVTDNRITPGRYRLTSYETGVTYAAMDAAANTTGDERYRQFADLRLQLIARQIPLEKDSILATPHYDAQMRKVVNPSALDDAGAMCSALIRLQLASLRAGQQPSADYDAMIRTYVDYVMKDQYRLPNGIFARMRPHKNTVWLDDMYMGVPCLAWYGRYLTEQGKASEGRLYLNEAVRQILLFKEIMWVPEKQLFRHGWVEAMDPHPAYHWGRANGWAILTMCEVLDAFPADFASRETILDLLRQHIEGLARLQDKTGLWHQLLDQPDTYLESSCTMIYCYALSHAICEGWIDPVAYGAQTLLAWNAAASQINALGQVENTCVGTGMGFDKAFYAYRPVHVMAAHGYGPAIWAGAEIIRLLRTTHPKMNDSAIRFYPREQQTNEPIFNEDEDNVELW